MILGSGDFCGVGDGDMCRDHSEILSSERQPQLWISLADLQLSSGTSAYI
jgi:hypothetical protein